MSQLTAMEALDLIAKQAQWCRENGEYDMRVILTYVKAIKSLIVQGKTAEEIITHFAEEED